MNNQDPLPRIEGRAVWVVEFRPPCGEWFVGGLFLSEERARCLLGGVNSRIVKYVPEKP